MATPQNLINVLVHFVWGTWDRLPLITPNIERRLHRHIEAVSLEMKCDVLALNGTEDHVHLLVALHNTVTLADLMARVKGASSHFVNEELNPDIPFKWQGSYGAFSVSPSHKRQVMDYINRQKEHHALGTFRPNAEKMATYYDRDS